MASWVRLIERAPRRCHCHQRFLHPEFEASFRGSWAPPKGFQNSTFALFPKQCVHPEGFLGIKRPESHQGPRSGHQHAWAFSVEILAQKCPFHVHVHFDCAGSHKMYHAFGSFKGAVSFFSLPAQRAPLFFWAIWIQYMIEHIHLFWHVWHDSTLSVRGPCMILLMSLTVFQDILPQSCTGPCEKILWRAYSKILSKKSLHEDLADAL